MRKLIILLFTVLFCSCSFSGKPGSNKKERVTFLLPQWPQELPPLKGWSLLLDGAEERILIGPEEKSYTSSLARNRTFFICAYPLTECGSFFKCAGTIYPFEKQLSWSGGYAANTMKILKAKSSLSNQDGSEDSKSMEKFLSSYNWGKFIQLLEEKQQEQTGLYNPWLLDSQKVLEGIAFHNFSATKLNLSDTVIFEPEEAVFSSFVPLNLPEEGSLTENKAGVCIKKGRPSLFLLKSEPNYSGVIICASSIKNISMDYVSLPIFTKGI